MSAHNFFFDLPKREDIFNFDFEASLKRIRNREKRYKTHGLNGRHGVKKQRNRRKIHFRLRRKK